MTILATPLHVVQIQNVPKEFVLVCPSTKVILTQDVDQNV